MGKLVRALRGERGANLVEFALSITLMLVILAGVMDVGRAFYSYIAVTNASREGARRACRFPQMGPTPEAFVREAAIGEAQLEGIVLRPDQVTISRDPRGPTPGTPITVTVDYTVTTHMGGILGLDEIPMQRSTSMVVFGVD